jgi:2-oxoglutarate dehydrogenase E1 component
VCSGKVYFDLLEARREHNIKTISIIRLEQLYPFPREELVEMIAGYPNAEVLIWVQEEPRNQGAWSTLLSKRHLGGCFPDEKPLHCIARPYSASPAVGYLSLHREQQQQLVEEALGITSVETNEQQ